MLAHLALAALVALLLLAAGGPLATDDLWWHLALGRAYARVGPWLPADPLLYAAPAAPAPASWLADLGLHGVARLADAAGLRAVHALAVASILAMAWSLLRRAGASRSVASLGTAAFAALAAYRLFQLRPHLATLLATFALFRLLLEDRRPPSPARLALAAGLGALWANLHPGFALGPVLLGAAAAALALAAPLRARDLRPSDRARAARLVVAAGLCALAALANPSGVDAWLRLAGVGVGPPDLARVADEWARLEPFALPPANLPPSALSWALAWLLLLATVGASAFAVRGWRGPARPQADVDPALVGVAWASLAALLLAVRFLWLGIFPLLLAVRCGRAWLARRPPPARSARWLPGAAAAALVAAFLPRGDWPMLSGSLPSSPARYAEPYAADRYHAHAIWLLADASLEGRLFNDYFLGGFAGFWLAPRLGTFVNGTLNLASETLDDYRALRLRRGSAAGQSFLELLDRHRVDLFLGVGLPRLPREGRPWYYTTPHLEGAPGWIPVFRSLDSAVYLRASARNAPNLARLAAHYAEAGVPFDRERGFDPARVIDRAPRWAIRNGLVPADFASLQQAARSIDPGRRRTSLDRLSAIHAALGLYAEAIRLDRRLLRGQPNAEAVRRRLVWSLLHAGRLEEAARAAKPLSDAPHALSRLLARSARELAKRGAGGADPALVVRLPLLLPREAERLMRGVMRPAPRPLRGAGSGGERADGRAAQNSPRGRTNV